MSTPRSAFVAGLKAGSPILMGIVPFALISGVAAVEIGLSPVMAMGLSLIVFAGASQLAAVQLMAVSASPLIIVLTTFFINLRFAMYSASLAPHLKPLSTLAKSCLAYLLTDQAYAVAIARFTENSRMPHKAWFFLGAALALWGTWQGCSLIGIFVGTQVPPSWSLDFAIPLTFMALVFPALKDGAAGSAALVAGLTAVLALKAPFNLGLITAALLGIGAGLLVESLRKG
ncbi:MAG: AzlC family ABC transporter permease [Anaerolineae bacterium]|nr:AzlC family ABC transporter permease [Anaerolineae bacterium]